jgi:quercetin dioxygenase-like cupin family protein
MESVQAQVADLAAVVGRAAAGGMAGAVWSLASADLNLNLVRFPRGDGVAAHVNDELDVAGVVLAGEGVLELEGREEPLRAGTLFFVPKGARRAIRATGAELAYLSFHRRRPGLMPARAASPQPRSGRSAPRGRASAVP